MAVLGLLASLLQSGHHHLTSLMFPGILHLLLITLFDVSKPDKCPLPENLGKEQDGPTQAVYGNISVFPSVLDFTLWLAPIAT